MNAAKDLANMNYVIPDTCHVKEIYEGMCIVLKDIMEFLGNESEVSSPLSVRMNAFISNNLQNTPHDSRLCFNSEKEMQLEQCITLILVGVRDSLLARISYAARSVTYTKSLSTTHIRRISCRLSPEICIKVLDATWNADETEINGLVYEGNISFHFHMFPLEGSTLIILEDCDSSATLAYINLQERLVRELGLGLKSLKQ